MTYDNESFDGKTGFELMAACPNNSFVFTRSLFGNFMDRFPASWRKQNAEWSEFLYWVFIAYLPVSAFGIYMEGLALIFWLALVFGKGRIHLKAIASVLLLLAWLGTSKAAWVIGLRH